MKDLVESGKVKPIIEKQYTLNEAADALDYYSDGHPLGKVVINIADMESE